MWPLADLVELGPAPETILDTFGGQLEPLTGSLRSGLVPRMLRTALPGQAGRGYAAAGTADLKLRIAELMTDLNVPAVLASRLTARVATHILAQTALGAAFDWVVVLRRIADYSAADLSVVMATLTADGTLIATEQ